MTPGIKRKLLLGAVCTTALFSLVWLTATTKRTPTVVVLPYLQPGDGRDLSGSDVKVILWLTDQVPGEFVVEVSGPAGPPRVIRPVRTALDFAKYIVENKDKPKSDEPAKEKDKKKTTGKDAKEKVPVPEEKEQHYYRYMAYVDQLPFNAEIKYRVKLGNEVIREASFRTRATANKSVRCALVGDMATGRSGQKAVAYQISQRHPDFLVALGDIVYPTGRVNQYLAYFWNVYNDVPNPGPKTGAPLMATVTFYPVQGNHDVGARPPAVPDGLGVYYFFAPPKGGPGEGPWATPLGKDEAAAERFRALAADSYPNLDAYSFDYGPAHFAVLNTNNGIQVNAAALREWLLADLKASKAPWKLVCYHAPAFQSSKSHYAEQQCRLLQPIFEEGGVDLVFAGHVHNYQRSVPIKFEPTGGYKKGKVNGKFTLDRNFDGVRHTRPDGVIHMVAGGGGASLYGPGLEKTAPQLRKDHGGNYADYTARMVVDRHTFVTLDLSPERVDLQAFAADGQEVDRIAITKR